jgi:hypothetical protein
VSIRGGSADQARFSGTVKTSGVTLPAMDRTADVSDVGRRGPDSL